MPRADFARSCKICLLLKFSVDSQCSGFKQKQILSFFGLFRQFSKLNGLKSMMPCDENIHQHLIHTFQRKKKRKNSAKRKKSVFWLSCKKIIWHRSANGLKAAEQAPIIRLHLNMVVCRGARIRYAEQIFCVPSFCYVTR